MTEINRHDVREQNALSGVIEAGGVIFVGHCCHASGKPPEDQINGALDHLSERLSLVGLTPESVVQLDAMFRNVY